LHSLDLSRLQPHAFARRSCGAVRCATRALGQDDAVGLLGGRVAHAECALLRWLGSYERLRQLVT